jgi:ethanolamine utilization microcompartment shell protein EutS
MVTGILLALPKYMNEFLFDTLELKKSLENVGVPARQAEKYIEVMAKIINDKLATKSDLKLSELTLKNDIKAVEVALRNDITAVEAALRNDITAVETALRNNISAVEKALKNDISAVEVALEHTEISIRNDMEVKFGKVNTKFAELELNINKALDRKLGILCAVIAILMAIYKYT